MDLLTPQEQASVGHRLRSAFSFYGWRLVAVSASMLTLVSLLVFQGAGAYFHILEIRFGWTRSMLSLAFSLSRAEGAILGPIEGFLIDKIGARKMVLIGYVIMAIGFFMFSQVQEIWHFYIAFLTITLGSGVGGFLPLITAVNHWFNRKRTSAMAVTMSGINLGGLFVPLLALGLASAGFRWTTGGIACLLLLIAYPAYKFIRTSPEEYGLTPDGEPPPVIEQPNDNTAMAEDQGLTAREALRTSAFWIITMSNIASAVPLVSLMVHLVPKLTDMGHSLEQASIIVTVFTLVGIPTVFLAGYLGDRFPKTVLLFIFMAIQGIAILVLAVADSPMWAWVFAPLYGIAFGARIPLSTAMRGEYFGRKAFATIMGISQFPSNLAMMLGPVFAGWVFDIQGTYFIPFIVFSALSFVGGVLILFAKKPQLRHGD